MEEVVWFVLSYTNPANKLAKAVWDNFAPSLASPQPWPPKCGIFSPFAIYLFILKIDGVDLGGWLWVLTSVHARCTELGDCICPL